MKSPPPDAFEIERKLAVSVFTADVGKAIARLEMATVPLTEQQQLMITNVKQAVTALVKSVGAPPGE